MQRMLQSFIETKPIAKSWRATDLLATSNLMLMDFLVPDSRSNKFDMSESRQGWIHNVGLHTDFKFDDVKNSEQSSSTQRLKETQRNLTSVKSVLRQGSLMCLSLCLLSLARRAHRSAPQWADDH